MVEVSANPIKMYRVHSNMYLGLSGKDNNFYDFSTKDGKDLSSYIS